MPVATGWAAILGDMAVQHLELCHSKMVAGLTCQSLACT